MQDESITPIGYEEFKAEWLSDIISDNLSTTEKGRRFAYKLLTQWLDLGDDTDEVFPCDGSGDGGIDIAYRFESEDDSDDAESRSSHTWYLVQSKYGKAFQGDSTLLKEGRKVIDTLSNTSRRLSSLTEEVLEELKWFKRRASDRDRITLVFATSDPLTNSQRDTLKDIAILGRSKLGSIFDVEAVSIETIYGRTFAETPGDSRSLNVPIAANLGPSEAAGEQLLVFSLSLMDLYAFLSAYHQKTGDIDQIYERNLRRYLGGRGKVNRAIQQTLRENPELFGLYNNGITIVVTDYRKSESGSLRLYDPYIVNGCQTTRTVWDVFRQRLASGGTGEEDPEQLNWRERAEQGVVITKIVKVGDNGEDLLEKITRYTNSQNAVKEKDFVALNEHYKSWKKRMEEEYRVFLEIQRGEWESQRARQRQYPLDRQFTQHANAFDLLKVYGSGWMGEAGNAYGRNAAYLPNGSVFKQMMNQDDGEPIDADDLFAAYQLQQAAEEYKFGRGVSNQTRRMTRYLYYAVVIDLLKEILWSGKPLTGKSITRGINKLFESGEQKLLLEAAITALDEYLTPGKRNSIYEEPTMKMTNNLNGYLKSEKVARGDGYRNLVSDYGRALKLSGPPSTAQRITAIVTGSE